MTAEEMTVVEAIMALGDKLDALTDAMETIATRLREIDTTLGTK